MQPVLKMKRRDENLQRKTLHSTSAETLTHEGIHHNMGECMLLQFAIAAWHCSLDLKTSLDLLYKGDKKAKGRKQVIRALATINTVHYFSKCSPC